MNKSVFLVQDKDIFDSDQKKELFAKFVADLFPDSIRFEPYMPNQWDYSFWTVDRGNDWKLKFMDDRVVEIRYRYHRDGNHYALVSLANWIKWHYGEKFTVVEKKYGIEYSGASEASGS